MRPVTTLSLLALVGCGNLFHDEPPCPDKMTATTTAKERPDVAEYPREANCVDTYLASRIDASATSAGLDESYAVSQEDVYPWTNVTFNEARLACMNAGKDLCRIKSYHGSENRVPGVSNFGTYYETIHRTGSFPIDINERHAAVAVDDVQLLPAWHSNRFISGAVTTFRARVSGGWLSYEDQDFIDDGLYPVQAEDFRSPLLGFRCCLPRIFGDIVEPLNREGTYVRESEDGEVLSYFEP